MIKMISFKKPKLENKNVCQFLLCRKCVKHLFAKQQSFDKLFYDLFHSLIKLNQIIYNVSKSVVVLIEIRFNIYQKMYYMTLEFSRLKKYINTNYLFAHKI